MVGRLKSQFGFVPPPVHPSAAVTHPGPAVQFCTVVKYASAKADVALSLSGIASVHAPLAAKFILLA